jgi:hypothetical protein
VAGPERLHGGLEIHRIHGYARVHHQGKLIGLVHSHGAGYQGRTMHHTPLNHHATMHAAARELLHHHQTGVMPKPRLPKPKKVKIRGILRRKKI